MRKQLQDLARTLDEEIRNAGRIAADSRESAHEIGRVAAASPSSSGDRVHAANQAELNEEKLEDLIAFRESLRDSVDRAVPEQIEPVCFVSLKFEGGKTLEVYFASASLHFKNVTVVTSNSPLGGAVVGKKIGESFSYDINGSLVSGVIADIR